MGASTRDIQRKLDELKHMSLWDIAEAALELEALNEKLSESLDGFTPTPEPQDEP